MIKDKFNGNYMYGKFPDVTVKSNFCEYFFSDYHDELYSKECYFVTYILGRKVEFGLIGNGHYVSFTNRISETLQEFSDRLYNSNSYFRLQHSKNTPEEFQEMLNSFRTKPRT